MRPLASESGQHILELSELHLRHRFLCLCAGCENVQDEATPIYDLAVNNLFEIPELDRTEIVVEYHDVDLFILHELSDLPRLAAADERGRIDVVALLRDFVPDVGAGGVCK